MPLHQKQSALKSEYGEAKKIVDGMKPEMGKFRNPKTEEQYRQRTAYNSASIRYEKANHELNTFNKDNKSGLKAEAKAGPQPQMGPTPGISLPRDPRGTSTQPVRSGGEASPLQHPTSLIPGHPDGMRTQSHFAPNLELFMEAPSQAGHNHPSVLTPGHADSAPAPKPLPPELLFNSPEAPRQESQSQGRTQPSPGNGGNHSRTRIPAGPRPPATDTSSAARLEQARHDLRAAGIRVPLPENPRLD